MPSTPGRTNHSSRTGQSSRPSSSRGGGSPLVNRPQASPQNATNNRRSPMRRSPMAMGRAQPAAGPLPGPGPVVPTAMPGGEVVGRHVVTSEEIQHTTGQPASLSQTTVHGQSSTAAVPREIFGSFASVSGRTASGDRSTSSALNARTEELMSRSRILANSHSNRQNRQQAIRALASAGGSVQAQAATAPFTGPAADAGAGDSLSASSTVAISSLQQHGNLNAQLSGSGIATEELFSNTAQSNEMLLRLMKDALERGSSAKERFVLVQGVLDTLQEVDNLHGVMGTSPSETELLHIHEGSGVGTMKGHSLAVHYNTGHGVQAHTSSSSSSTANRPSNPRPMTRPGSGGKRLTPEALQFLMDDDGSSDGPLRSSAELVSAGRSERGNGSAVEDGVDGAYHNRPPAGNPSLSTLPTSGSRPVPVSQSPARLHVSVQPLPLDRLSCNTSPTIDTNRSVESTRSNSSIGRSSSISSAFSPRPTVLTPRSSQRQPQPEPVQQDA